MVPCDQSLPPSLAYPISKRHPGVRAYLKNESSVVAGCIRLWQLYSGITIYIMAEPGLSSCHLDMSYDMLTAMMHATLMQHEMQHTSCVYIYISQLGTQGPSLLRMSLKITG